MSPRCPKTPDFGRGGAHRSRLRRPLKRPGERGAAAAGGLAGQHSRTGPARFCSRS